MFNNLNSSQTFLACSGKQALKKLKIGPEALVWGREEILLARGFKPHGSLVRPTLINLAIKAVQQVSS